MQVGAPEVRSAAHGSGEGCVGQVLPLEVAVALVGERVVHLFLEQGTILQSHPS